MEDSSKYDRDDIRTSVNLDQEVSPWFWGVVDQGRQDREVLKQVLQAFSREDLIRFQTELERTASFFESPPFQSEHLALSSNQINEAAQRLVSQGKAFAKKIWANPPQFWDIVQQLSDDSVNSSYESVAVNVFLEKFGEEMPPLNYSY